MHDRFHAACKLRWTLRSLAILNCNYTLTLEQIYSSTGLSHDSSRYMYHFSIQCSQLENHKQGPTLMMPARYRTQGLAHNSVIGVPASTRYETLPSPTQSWRQGEDCSQHKHEPSHMMRCLATTLPRFQCTSLWSGYQWTLVVWPDPELMPMRRLFTTQIYTTAKLAMTIHWITSHEQNRPEYCTQVSDVYWWCTMCCWTKSWCTMLLVVTKVQKITDSKDNTKMEWRNYATFCTHQRLYQSTTKLPLYQFSNLVCAHTCIHSHRSTNMSISTTIHHQDCMYHQKKWGGIKQK